MRLTNEEFLLLQIICFRKEVARYDINYLVKRWEADWVDIGTVSVDVALKSLSKQQFVNCTVDTTIGAISEQGPRPIKFAITNDGKKILQQEIIKTLSSSRERDYRFDVALAAIPLVSAEEVVVALHNRKTFLAAVTETIHTQFESQGGKTLPLNLQYLFRHHLLVIKGEIDYMDILLQKLSLPSNPVLSAVLLGTYYAGLGCYRKTSY